MSRRRIRSLKPEFFEDEEVGAISRDARLVMIGLITLADDRGRMHYRPLAILGDIFPEEAVTVRQMRGWLAEIIGIELALVYKVTANEYLWLPQFLRHQVVNKPTESILPPHPDDALAMLPISEAFKAAKRRDDYRTTPVEPPDPSGSSTVGLPPYARSVPFPSSSKPSTETAKVDPRAVALCSRLASAILLNDPKAKVAPESVGWLKAARLLLDRDGRTVEEVERVIDWCQADEFWRANILSMPKLREKYSQLLLRMNSPKAKDNELEARRLDWLGATV